MKKSLFLIFSCLLFGFANAQELNFKTSNNEIANNIVKDFLEEEFEKNGEFETISHFADINNDEENEILSIFKNGNFHKMRGYKLIVLKRNNDGYRIMDSDVYFDIEYPITIKKKKITYRTTSFYKNKKYKAKVKKNEIVTKGLYKDCFKDCKMNKIEKATQFEHHETKTYSQNDFNCCPQKTIKISYPNLNEKTKHYLDMQ